MAFSRHLRVFSDTRSIPKGRIAHGKIITSGFQPNVITNNHLICMYFKFGRVHDARNVFDRMPERNLITWSTLVSGYSKMGMAKEALYCFRLLVNDGFDPNDYTYVGALSACASIGAARTGKEIHGRIFRTGQELNSHVSNCLINMYAKGGLLNSAQLVFDANLEPNSVSWTSILSGYCQDAKFMEGLKLLLQSHRAGVKVDEFSCATVLRACAELENLAVGMQVHSHAIKRGVRSDEYVMTSLINFYAKCAELNLARIACLEIDKPQLSAWTALIGGCVQQGKGRDAIDLFCKLHSSGLKPIDRTFSSVFGAFSDSMEIEVGKQLHSLIIRLGFNSTFVGNAVLDFYSKCGLLEESLRTFEEMDGHDVISWNSLISGRVKCGCYREAVQLLTRMFLEGFDPNLYTYSSILSLFGNLPAIEWGKQTHCRIIKPGFDSNLVVGSALIDMYAKCGRLSDARKIFNNLTPRNLVSWNTMLVGYAQHGLGKEAFDIYDLMQRDGIKPNDITFIGLLSACGHMGLVEEGWRHFNLMRKDHGIAPTADHLACMVNLFARKGQTERAFEFIKGFPMEADKVVWRCLLSGCKTNKDLTLGRYAAEQILSIDPNDTSAHIMLSNIYAEAKLRDEFAQVRKVMKEKALKKDPGYSWTELKNNAYCFTSGHASHFQGINPHKVLKGLTAQLFDAGYVPDVFSLH